MTSVERGARTADRRAGGETISRPVAGRTQGGFAGNDDNARDLLGERFAQGLCESVDPQGFWAWGSKKTGCAIMLGLRLQELSSTLISCSCSAVCVVGSERASERASDVCFCSHPARQGRQEVLVMPLPEAALQKENKKESHDSNTVVRRTRGPMKLLCMASLECLFRALLREGSRRRRASDVSCFCCPPTGGHVHGHLRHHQGRRYLLG